MLPAAQCSAHEREDCERRGAELRALAATREIGITTLTWAPLYRPAVAS